MPSPAAIEPQAAVSPRRAVSITAVIVASLIGMLAQFLGSLAAEDRIWLDAQFAYARSAGALPSANDPVIVGIDQEFLDSVDEPLALSHRYLAELLNGLALAKPAVVAVDLVLPNKRFDKLVPVDDPAQDYHRSLLQGVMNIASVLPLILAKAWNEPRGRFEEIQVDFRSVIELAKGNGTGMGSSMLCADADQRIREYPGTWCQPDGGLSLAAAVAAAAGNQQDWTGLINFGLGREFDYIPIDRVRTLAKQENVAELGRLFRGRAVFVGAVLEHEDLHYVPVPLAQWRPNRTDVHGVVVHAQIFRTMMNHGFVMPIGQGFGLVGILIGALFGLGTRQWVKAGCLTLFVAASLAISWALFSHGLWFPPSTIIFTAVIAFLGRASFEAWGHFSEKKRLQRSFAGYVSPSVMTEIVSGRLAAKHNDRRHVAVLFSDIRNFTTLSEASSPDAVVTLLTRYFDRMTTAVHRNGGTLDKFIGDGIMVLFGAPNRLESAERAALECAHEMLLELAVLNRELVAEGQSPLTIGIGIHAGDAIVGNIGAGERHEYTAIGDTVNAAARLKALCKEVGYPIVLSEDVWLTIGCPPFMEDCGARALTGHSSMRVFGWRPRAEPNA